MAQFIINQGTDVNVRDFLSDKTPLIIAAENNSIDVASLLAVSRANLELVGKEYSSTALLWAAWKNNYEIVKMLLKAKSDVEATNDSGFTAFSIATDPEILALLNDNKDVRINRQEKNVGGIPSKIGQFSFIRNVEGRPSGVFISNNVNQEEFQDKVKLSLLEVSTRKEQTGKSCIPAQDHNQSSSYIADNFKLASVAEASEFNTSAKECGDRKFGDIQKGIQKDWSNSQRQSLERTDLVPISVKSMSVAQDHDKDYQMELISENRSVDSSDGYSSD